ncbi:MAG: hypothetical protein IT546_12175 [Caulobacteraceae bacterium]|nr:hypothetical protein [Caulobacteraceae bacterium]
MILMAGEANDFEATKRVFLARFDALVAAWAECRDEIEQAQAFIADQTSKQESYRVEADQLQTAALALGFDMYEASRERDENEERAETLKQMPQRQAAPISIKNTVLDEARAAHPRPVRAAEIREKLRELGHDIHDKTIGMTLYRWSKKGAIRRDGVDWYYVPEDQRSPAAEAEEDLIG